MLRHTSQMPPRLNIAVVGTGIAGMSAAWLLSGRHDVTVFEKEPRTGGHSNTVSARGTPVDTGFIVYNEVNYPNLVQLFRHLGVETKASDMSFAVSLGSGNFEYAGTDLNGLIGQRRNALRPRFWYMMKDLLRFYREAPAFLDNPAAETLSLGDYLARNGYGEAFVEDHLLPMAAAIWSASADEIRAYPTAAFLRFFVSHGLVNLTDRPEWRTVAGGSRAYVEKLTAPFAHRIRKGVGVRQLSRAGGRVELIDTDGKVHTFDGVVVATHADQALALLADADPLERELLGAFAYSKNRAVLHSDATLMPSRQRVWASWNYIGDGGPADSRRLCVTYWMNRLQGIDSANPLFVTLNPIAEPNSAKVVAEFDYEHPLFDLRALAAQRRLWELQGRGGVWFAGSYFGYGFHEDALQAGLAAAEFLGGVRRPWTVENESGRIHVGAEFRVAAE